MSKKIEKLKEINRLLGEVISKLETRMFVESVGDIKENSNINEILVKIK